MSFYVYSTLTNATSYVIYAPSIDDGGLPPEIARITINGGSNVQPLPQFGIITPRGVMTEVTDEEMEMLRNDYHFKEHMKHGFITFEEKPRAVEKVIDDMEKKDASAPKTPDDFVQIDKGEGENPSYKGKGSKRK